MLLKKRKNYLYLNNNEKLCLVSELHLIRDSLKEKKTKKVKKKKQRKLRRPTMLSSKIEAIFDKLPEESKRFILYGNKE